MKAAGRFFRVHAWLLARRLSPRWIEFVQGDLKEEFDRRCDNGTFRAGVWLSWQTLCCMLAPPPAHSQIREEPRQGDGSMRSLPQDLRYALRLLRKSPGFTLTAVFTLALGIGANTSIFSIVHAAILRPLPYSESERLLILRDAQGTNETPASYPEYLDWRAHANDIAVVAGIVSTTYTVGGADPESVMAQRVSASLWQVLDVHPVLGRSFTEREDLPSADRVAMIGHGVWQRRFGSDPTVIGRSMLLDDVPYTVVGILPKGFRGVLPRDSTGARPREVWVPLRLSEGNAPRGLHFMTVIARPRDDVSVDRVRARFTMIAAGLKRENRTTHGIVARPLIEYVASGSRDVLFALGAALAAVLLIACANIANLQLARAASRQGEVSIRLAIGASRGRMVQQFLAESVLLAGIGGALGLLVAWAVLQWFVATEPLTRVNSALVTINAQVLAFTAAISLMTGLAFGLVPALQARRTRFDAVLSGSARRPEGPRGTLRGVLVTTELAIAVVLVFTAGLLTQSLLHLAVVDKGFDGSHVTAFDLSLSRSVARNPERQVQVFQEILEEIRTTPGVERVALINDLPLGGGGVNGDTPIPGRISARDEVPVAEKRIVSPGYFELLRIPVTQGREFTVADRQGSAPVALVSEAFARKYFGGESPLGKRIQFAWDFEGSQEIVGVVGDVRHDGLDMPPEPTVYVCYLQRPDSAFTILTRSPRSSADLGPALREAIHRVDPSRPVPIARELDAIVGASLQPRRMALTVILGFAILALLLAFIGVYGLISYATRGRTREIGIRVALGARPRDVLRLVMAQGLVLTFVGLILGTAGCFAATTVIRAYLFATSPTDPAMIATTAIVLAFAGITATLLPASRATRIDPVRALRE